MRRDSSVCAKSVRYNIFTNGAPYTSACVDSRSVCHRLKCRRQSFVGAKDILPEKLLCDKLPHKFSSCWCIETL